MKLRKISISKGNTKVGKTPSVSLPPILSCPANVPCATDCYAVRNMMWRKNVRASYKRNWQIWRQDAGKYFDQLDLFLTRAAPAYFRFHVSGDIPDQDYLDRMCALARKHNLTRFVCFTKNFDLNFKEPRNLCIVFSAWPNTPLPPRTHPVAFMDDGTEHRSFGAYKCKGGCEGCRACWYLAVTEQDVVFNKH